MIKLLLLLHVTLAAVVFGAPIGSIGTARRALAVSPDAFALAAVDADRRGRLASICAMLLLLTGLGLVFAYGGFSAVTSNFAIALGVMLAGIAFSFAWMKPTGARLVALSQARPVETVAAEAALNKLAFGSGVLHTLWLALLALMYFRF